MASGTDGATARQLGRLFGAGTLAGLTEGQLLERFVARGDELAFAALVERHGPMVLGVCRRALADRHDVEDAFQATFLVLVRRAGSIRDREGLAPWLYGVARRVAARARGLAARRRQVEGAALDAVAALAVAAPEPPGRFELGPLLDEEIARLPAVDREAIVLCDLQGRPGEEAARLLGLRAVTLRSRLHRARKKLRERLARRGVAPGALAAAWLANGAAPASELSEATITAAIRFAARPAAAGATSARVAALTDGVLKAMFLTKFKLAAAAAVTLGLVAGVAAQQAGPPGRSPSDEDRLRQVEAKLDRVLGALENRAGSIAATPERVYVARAGADGMPTITAVPVGAKPNGLTGVVAVGAETAKPDSPQVGRPNDRLSRVEQRLDDLERRIARLEQQQGRAGAADPFRGTTTTIGSSNQQLNSGTVDQATSTTTTIRATEDQPGLQKK